MSKKQRVTLSQKLEIISVSYEIGLRRTEKLYDSTKKTIQNWRKKYQQAGTNGLVSIPSTTYRGKISVQDKKAITDLCRNQPQISGREIMEKLQLDCSVQALLKVRKKIISASSIRTNADSWFLSCHKLSCNVNTKAVYLITATHSQSGITLFALAEENIPVYLNAFVEQIILFLNSIDEMNTIKLIANSSRFNLQARMPGLNTMPIPSIEYCQSTIGLPENLKQKIRTLPAEFSNHSELLRFLEDIFFIFNIGQIQQNQHTGNSKLLLHQPSVISINTPKNSFINKNMEQVTDKIVNLIDGEIAKFNLSEAKNLLNFLIKINAFEHKSVELQIKIQILSAATIIYSYDYNKAFYHYSKALKMAKSSDNSQLIVTAQIALANYYLITSQYGKCEKALQHALKLSCDIGIKESKGEILYKLGQLYKIISDSRASTITDQLLEIALEDDNKELFCKSMNLMTTIYFADGFYEKGLSCAFKSLNLAGKYNFQQAVFEANYNIAEYGLRTDKFVLAEKHLLLNVKSALNLENYNQDNLKNQIRLGLIRCHLNQIKNGVQLIEKCLSLSQKRGDYYSESLSYNYLAQAYMHTHEDKKAIFYFNKAAKINEQLGSREQQIATFSGLAHCYGKIKQTKKAIFYSHKKLEAVKHTKNRVHIASAYGQIASAVVNDNELDTAIKYYQLQLKILKPTDADIHKFYALANIATILLHNQDYRQAYSYFKKAEKKLIALNRNQDLDRIYYDLARITKATGRFKKMREYIRLAKEKAEIMGNANLIEQADALLKDVE